MLAAISHAVSPIFGFLNRNIGLITLIAGFAAIYLYLKQKKDHKRDAARLVLQEIRYAEQRVRNYRTYATYSFSEKLLPTNSWHKNIHLFVKDLKETEIDLISKFFSNAAYLDEVIATISDHSTKIILQPPTPVIIDDTTKVGTKIATADLSQPAKELIESISKTIEYIYNTPAIDKLRLISEKKLYELY
jgi:hypothetical protein